MDPQALAGLLILAAPALLTLWLCWRIVTKAGYHGAWSLIMLLPPINLVAIYVFAFSDWPALRRLRLGTG